MNFYSKISNAILVLIIVLFAIYTWGRSNSSETSGVPVSLTASQPLDFQVKVLEDEVDKNEEQGLPQLKNIEKVTSLWKFSRKSFLGKCSYGTEDN